MQLFHPPNKCEGFYGSQVLLEKLGRGPAAIVEM